MRCRRIGCDQVPRPEPMAGSEIRVVAAAHNVLNAVRVDRGMAAEPQAAVHVAVVLAVEDDHGREDGHVGEKARPPQVPTSGPVGHPEKREKVVDESHARKITADTWFVADVEAIPAADSTPW